MRIIPTYFLIGDKVLCIDTQWNELSIKRYGDQVMNFPVLLEPYTVKEVMGEEVELDGISNPSICDSKGDPLADPVFHHRHFILIEESKVDHPMGLSEGVDGKLRGWLSF